MSSICLQISSTSDERLVKKFFDKVKNFLNGCHLEGDQILNLHRRNCTTMSSMEDCRKESLQVSTYIIKAAGAVCQNALKRVEGGMGVQFPSHMNISTW